MTDETVKRIQKLVERSDDTTIALDYIKSAIVVDCAESLTANDGHILTDEEMQVVNARLLMKALTMLDDHEMHEILSRLNNDKKHDAHTELLLKLIDHEFDKLREEHKKDAFLERVTHNDKD